MSLFSRNSRQNCLHTHCFQNLNKPGSINCCNSFFIESGCRNSYHWLPQKVLVRVQVPAGPFGRTLQVHPFSSATLCEFVVYATAPPRNLIQLKEGMDKLPCVPPPVVFGTSSVFPIIKNLALKLPKHILPKSMLLSQFSFHSAAQNSKHE